MTPEPSNENTEKNTEPPSRYIYIPLGEATSDDLFDAFGTIGEIE